MPFGYWIFIWTHFRPSFTIHVVPDRCCPNNVAEISKQNWGTGAAERRAFRAGSSSAKNVRHPSSAPPPFRRAPPRALRRPSRHPTRGPVPRSHRPRQQLVQHARGPRHRPAPAPGRTRRAPVSSPMYIVAHAKTINATKAAIHAPAATTRTAVAPPATHPPRLCPRPALVPPRTALDGTRNGVHDVTESLVTALQRRW